MFVQPFTLQIPDEKLAEIRERLTHARWPKTRPASGWSMGTDLAFLRRAVDYWLHEFDWRKQEAALNRLGEDWAGGFIVGHGMDTAVLRKAGIEDADSVVVSTDGDNTNLVIGQVAQKRFGIECTVVRILDPARAEFYTARGLRTVCPTSTAIDALSDAVRSCDIPQRPLEEAPV